MFTIARIYSKKHIERTPERVNCEADTLKAEILEYAKGKIQEQEAELLSYKAVALMDFDNHAEMSIPADVRAKLIVDAYLE